MDSESTENLVPPPNNLKNNTLEKKIGVLVPPPNNMNGLPLFEAVTDKEVDGIGMGVLTDGTPYLTEVGISKVCGVDRKAIRTLSQNWSSEKTKPRGKFIASILDEGSYSRSELFIQVHTKTEQYVNAYPDVVCMALLEYYAFEAKNEIALDNYRKLARKTLRNFIYAHVGYDPQRKISEPLRKWHERIELNHQSAPRGFFGIFNEAHMIIYELIMAGAEIGEKTVPDISIGKYWSEYWDKQKLDEKYGDRQKFPHRYPSDHPQAKSNPQTANCYPIEALGEYRKWLQEEYIENGKFSNYLRNKNKEIPPSIAQLTIARLTHENIELPKP
jgi:hypothetical protein